MAGLLRGVSGNTLYDMSIPFSNYLEYIGAQFRIAELRSYHTNGGADDESVVDEINELEVKCEQYLDMLIGRHDPEFFVQANSDEGESNG